MPAHAEIDVRMKENYEFPYRIKLTKRTPVIIRVDGRAFHTFTRGFNRPFDEIMIKSMQDTTIKLCEEVGGCKLGYVQSDEISLLLIDYDTFSTEAWFGNNLQKICSISSSIATLAFNRAFIKYYVEDFKNTTILNTDELKKLDKSYDKALNLGAMFDARAFNIPKDEVCNYFLSRQLDASRNSIEMLGRAYFSHKELHKKNGSMIQDMLHEKHNINWNDLPTEQKRGACCIKEEYYIKDGYESIPGDSFDLNLLVEQGYTKRSRWIIDHDIPQFKGDERSYIDKYVFV